MAEALASWAMDERRRRAARARLGTLQDDIVSLRRQIAAEGERRHALEGEARLLEAQMATQETLLEDRIRPETRALRCKGETYASQRRESLRELNGFDLKKNGHAALQALRNEVLALRKARDKLREECRPFRDLSHDSVVAIDQLKVAKETLACLDAEFQELLSDIKI